jgi:hypothetical protein
VERDLPSDAYTVANPLAPGETLERGPNVGEAHDTGVYADTGRLVDYSSDPSVQRWLRDQEHFFTGDASVSRWQVNG